MTIEEKQYFDSKFGSLARTVGNLSNEVQTIKRGVYGDEENDVLGLITTDKLQHKRIKSLEDSRKKALWVGGTIIAGLELAWHGIQEWFMKK